MALKIVRHAIRMVVGNPADAAKASLGPIALGLAVVAILAFAIGIDPSALNLLRQPLADPQAPLEPAAAEALGGLALFGVAASAVSLFVLSWVAVVWHRFILLEEYPSAMPGLAGKPVWPYLAKSLWLAIVMIVVLIPVFFLAILMLGPVATFSPVLGGVAFSVGLGLVFGYLWLRWALVLPAAAVGRSMSLRDSWGTTRPLSGTIWSVSFLVIVLNFVLGLIALPFGTSILGLVVTQVVNWFTLMVGLSILTTLYGHLVENRPLVD